MRNENPPERDVHARAKFDFRTSAAAAESERDLLTVKKVDLCLSRGERTNLWKWRATGKFKSRMRQEKEVLLG